MKKGQISEVEKACIKGMFEEGVSAQDMAKQLDRSVTSIKKAIGPLENAKQKSERESFFSTQGIPDNLNNALVYVMRSGMKKAGNIVVDGKKVSLKKAFSLTDEQYKQVFPTVTKLNKFFSSIRDEAVAEGIKLGKIENYLPRSWSYAALKQELKNLDRGIEGKLVKEIKLKEKLKTTKQVRNLLEEMLDPNQRRLNPFDNVPECSDLTAITSEVS